MTHTHTFVTVVMATLPLKFTVDDTAGTRNDSILHAANLALDSNRVRLLNLINPSVLDWRSRNPQSVLTEHTYIIIKHKVSSLISTLIKDSVRKSCWSCRSASFETHIWAQQGPDYTVRATRNPSTWEKHRCCWRELTAVSFDHVLKFLMTHWPALIHCGVMLVMNSKENLPPAGLLILLLLRKKKNPGLVHQFISENTRHICTQVDLKSLKLKENTETDKPHLSVRCTEHQKDTASWPKVPNSAMCVFHCSCHGVCCCVSVRAANVPCRITLLYCEPGRHTHTHTHIPSASYTKTRCVCV